MDIYAALTPARRQWDMDERGKDAFRAAQKRGTNVFWFRRLKWGDPERRLRMGNEPPSQRRGGHLGIPIILMLFIGAAVGGWALVSLLPF